MARQILDWDDLPVAGFSTDAVRADVFIEASPNFEALTRVPAEEWLDRLAPESRAEILARVRALAADERTSLPRYRIRIGERDRWYEHSIGPVRSGKRLHVLSDVTSQHEVESELRQKSERLELVLEGTRLGMWDWNPVTNDVAFNARWAEMLGYELSEIEQNLSSWQTRVHPDDLAACIADITAHMKGEVPFYENVHRMRHKDGRWIYILDRGKIMERDAEGRAVRFTGTHTEVTRQMQAEAEARRAAAAKSRFLANMSHEVRTPLTGILGLTEVLLLQDLPDPARWYLETIASSGTTLLTIINDILDFSKIESGKLSLHIEPVSLRDLVESVAVLFRNLSRAKGVELLVTSEGSLPDSVLADPTRLRQILANLVSNAVKFTKQGSIHVRVRLLSQAADSIRVRLEVEDTGPGIPRDFLPRLFDRFAQGDGTGYMGGSGLGLAICQMLAELMQSRIEVDTEEGRGSRFFLELLLPLAAPVARRVDTERRSAQGVSVLVADDNAVNRLILTAQAERAGASVECVDTGQAALDLALRGHHDVIFLDLHMPDIGGIEVAREIRKARGQSTKLVAFSADVFDDTRSACLDAGFDAFLGKPFRHDELLALLTPCGNTTSSISRPSV